MLESDFLDQTRGEKVFGEAIARKLVDRFFDFQEFPGKTQVLVECEEGDALEASENDLHNMSSSIGELFCESMKCFCGDDHDCAVRFGHGNDVRMNEFWRIAVQTWL